MEGHRSKGAATGAGLCCSGSGSALRSVALLSLNACIAILTALLLLVSFPGATITARLALKGAKPSAPPQRAVQRSSDAAVATSRRSLQIATPGSTSTDGQADAQQLRSGPYETQGGMPGSLGGIPGSTLQDTQEAARFRQSLGCTGAEGRWVIDPTPRLLPWPTDAMTYGHCDERWAGSKGRRGAQGIVARAAADEVVRSGAPAEQWQVRESLKYRWQVDEARCGKGARLQHTTGDEVLRSVLGLPREARRSAIETAGGGHAPTGDLAQGLTQVNEVKGSAAEERVILVVGDSMQNMFAHSIVDSMRVPPPIAGGAAPQVEFLPPQTLTCFQRRLEHRRPCWGARISPAAEGGAAAKLLFVRNDFLSLVKAARWTPDGRHFELPWINTLWLLLQQEQQAGGKGASGAGAQEGASDDVRPGSPGLAPILVLNRGLHYADDPEFFPELNATVHLAREVCPQCLILFRNTAGGHKGCLDHSAPLAQRPDDSELGFNWGSISSQSRDPRLRRIVESVGGVLLDVETMTSFRADGHTGRNRKGKEDCAHYCAPGPVDSWTQLLFHALVRLLG